jgi:site-specific DNA recombinase
VKALLYVRNSSASERSVEEQEAECRADCDRRGWTVETVVTDMVGASKHSKGTRHGWARVKKLLPQHDVLVTWEASRAQRDLAEYAELRDLCVASRVGWCYSGRLHDLSTADGQFATGLDALLAERETAVTRERIERAMRANAAAGKPHGRRLYGYQRTYDPTSGVLTGQIPHPTEAPIIRSIFDDYLSGIGLRTIAKRLEDEGVRTRRGNPWTDGQVRNVLERPGYCGRRVHRGQITPGMWEPIVSEATFDKVQERLARSAATRTRGTVTARMLTGVARCGKCGTKTYVGHNRGRRVYHCTKRGCMGAARDLVKLDAFVSEQIIRRFETGTPLDVAPVDDGLRLEVDALRARLDDAVGQFTAGRLSAATLAKIEGELLPAITAAEAARRRVGVPLEIDLPDDGDYRLWWDEKLLPEQRRAIATSLISAVTILPATRGSRNFDPLTVNVEWMVTSCS